MRTASVVSALLVAAGLAVPGLAAAELKIGFVNSRRAATEVEEGKAAIAQVKREEADKQKKLDERKAELTRLKADLDKQAMVLSDKAKEEKAAEFQQKLMEAQQLRFDMEQQLQQRQQELLGAVLKKMEPVVKEVAEASGITIVLEEGAVVYAPDHLDLTSEVVRKFNARYAKAPKK
jgi:outer membrane protein